MKPELRYYSQFCAVLLLAFSLHTCSDPIRKAQTITIATAANMHFAMKALTEEFTEKTGIPCNLVVSSSGKLTAQIKEGAPFDLFVAANMKYPEEIFKSGLAEGPPQIYAHGKLVLWTVLDDVRPAIPTLADPSIQHIAVANPVTAPYGIAAMESLRHYGLLDRLEDKLVYGESIAQTNQFIASKSAELGFTALSVVLAPSLKGKGSWEEIDGSTYAPIKQGVIQIKQSASRRRRSKVFLDYLFSHEAQVTLETFGYTVLHERE